MVEVIRMVRMVRVVDVISVAEVVLVVGFLEKAKCPKIRKKRKHPLQDHAASSW